MREAVVVSTARTPIGKAYRGAFNDTQAQDLAGHAIQHAVARAGIMGSEVDDVVSRQAALRAGLPDTVAGMSVDRQCASGLMAIATAAKQIVHDGMDITVGGGVESISLARLKSAATIESRNDRAGVFRLVVVSRSFTPRAPAAAALCPRSAIT